ncbi:MAG: bifunctional acetate--CoA ligase family protein/GNAT family N-acetyltransferase [Candidatus Competibacteraceae bacterium]|nr:bifunctional acetate--CoA ligase family protein/GNAT family N-acetyltransferase [Candidatus Competibacteraceae bacterium]
MSTRNLKYLFKPASIAVIGASNRAGSVGALVMRNLLHGGFQGPIMPVNPNYQAVAGIWAYPEVAALPMVPELAVICTSATTVPALIEELGQWGTRAAIVISADLKQSGDEQGNTLQTLMLERARAHNMRVLGPNCLGLLVPGIGLNASFMHRSAEPGRIAFVSQSGALCTAVLDWARAHNIGFSHFISLGSGADVDFGDVLDYLGSDPQTNSILLYIETIRARRNFMSAGRAAARNKPVIVIKAGRFNEGAKAVASHTGALAGADHVYDAAFRRAGMLRVYDIDDLFGAVETLARARPQQGDRLAILTNGGGVGVMAVDTLIEGGGKLAELEPATLQALNTVMPPSWSGCNPVDIAGDADDKRYGQALTVLLQASEVDAVLVMHAPTATADSLAVAKAVITCSRASRRNILSNWIGQEVAAAGRQMLAEAGIPSYETPSQAIEGFLQMVRYRTNRDLLMQTPPSAPSEFTPALDSARCVIENALAEGRSVLSEPEAKTVLAAYGMPVVETHTVTTPESAARVAAQMGYPVALKILSPEVSHKSDVGGVELFLDSDEAVRTAAETMRQNVARMKPEARVDGFTVQRMVVRPGAHELIIGATTDPIFGPVILFGQGGTAVEVIGDRAVALPPLNMNLARELIGRTRIVRLLEGYRDRPGVAMDALCLALLQVSQLLVDIPEVVELDINPLLSDENGVLVLDAHIRLEAASRASLQRLAIRPYPKELEEIFSLRNGRQVLLRPIRPEDEPKHYQFLSKLTPEDIRFRFFGLVRELPHSQMARLTQIDYDREMAFIATATDAQGNSETLGVVRTFTDPDNERAEYAIVVRSDMKGQRLGWKLLDKMIHYCRARGTRYIVGQILLENRRMLGMVQKMGFTRQDITADGVAEVSLKL